MSIKSQVENGSQDSGNSQSKPSAEEEGVNHGNIFLLIFLLCDSVFSLFWGPFWLCGKGGDYEYLLLEN